MKISTFLATGLGMFLFAGAASAETFTYEATLNGPNAGNAGSVATGTATAVLDDATGKLDVSMTYAGFTSAAESAHVYTGACGEEGTTIQGSLVPEPVSTAEGLFNRILDVDDEQIAAIKAGNSFVTISSEGAFAFTQFEIRGHLILRGTTNTCEVADAGTSTPDSGTTTPTVDAGTTTPDDDVITTDDGGCNTSGTGTNGTSGIVALGLGLAVYGIARKRMKKA